MCNDFPEMNYTVKYTCVLTVCGLEDFINLIVIIRIVTVPVRGKFWNCLFSERGSWDRTSSQLLIC